MRKIKFTLLVITLLLSLAACKDNNEPDINIDDKVISVGYEADSKSFILLYSSGKKEKMKAKIDTQVTPSMASIILKGTVYFVFDATEKDATIILSNDKMESVYYNSENQSFDIKYTNKGSFEKKAVIDSNTEPSTASLLLPSGVKLFFEDASKSGQADVKVAPPVAQFVYDGLSLFYLWSEDMINKIPTANHNNPKKYFESLLHKTDIEHGWSWITDDIESLLKDFDGEATNAFGFSPFVLWADKEKTQLLGFVRYVYPNTPAAKAGFERGNVITKINGENITLSNYKALYGSNNEMTFTVLNQDFTNPKDIKITPASFSTDPVLFSKVYEINGKKIAYLFYTGFKHNYNQSLFNAFSQFKQAGVTDLVLDLRYNPGGNVSSAVYLASLIAPEAVVRNKAPFSIMSYNNFINDIAKKNNWDVTDNLGEYNSGKESNPLDANLNLNKVYVIATESSASASELTTFCLRPYMNVVHIGEKTAGKYTASWTIHAYDDFKRRAQPVYDASKLSSADKAALKNWGMQPIVGRYTDKDGKDFINDGALIPNHSIKSQEYNTETWKPIGDVNDYLFAKAISLITGKPYNAALLRSSETKELINSDLYSPTENVVRNSVIQDNKKLNPEELQEIMMQIRNSRD